MITPVSSLPQHCPSPRELDDLELLGSGALAPLTAFGEPGSPVTLALPDAIAAEPVVELVDPEGLPLARVTLGDDGRREVETLTRAQHGPFRRLHLSVAEVRERYAGATFVPVTGPVTGAQLDELAARAQQGPLVLLALVGHGTPELSPVALLRATLRVAQGFPGAAVVAVPLASHGDSPADVEADHDLGVRVVAAYAGEDPVLGLVDDPDADPLPELDDIVDADQPEPARQGLVLLFTGLSGSGKSTLAQALMDRLLEQGGRTLTSLDGDVVRRHLSAGLGFGRADRETNIRRIGWVAAEVSRHGGVAVCSPIAPFDETRQQLREMVADAGGAFFLIHVATPLEECERRDRKGLYAKARAGEIPDFTGISSPYEEPDDADVRVDTTGRTIDSALADVLDALADAGYLDLRTQVVEPPEPHHPVVEPPEPLGEGESRPQDPRPFNVLFVCTANIARSPYLQLAATAQATAAGLTTADVVFTSAGQPGYDGEPMDPLMADELLRRGVPADAVAGFRSRPVTPALVAAADLVVTAEADHRRALLEEQPSAFRTVFTLGQLAEALTHVGPGLGRDDLLHALGERRGTATPDLDLTDPHGRGPEAAAACAQRADALLTTVLPALLVVEPPEPPSSVVEPPEPLGEGESRPQAPHADPTHDPRD